jgi:hypothetical protein
MIKSCGVVSFKPEQGQMALSCEQGNKHTSSIKVGKFLTSLA